jgi:hypothetical protein
MISDELQIWVKKFPLHEDPKGLKERVRVRGKC